MQSGRKKDSISKTSTKRRDKMSNPRPGSAGMSSRGGDCVECVRKRDQGHRNAREAKYCQRHQCEQKDASGVICTTRKKAADIRCPAHTKCTAHHCSNPRSVDAQGIPNEYCVDHTCFVEDCGEGKVHDPRRNVYDALCATHLLSKCAVTTCLSWKTERSRYCESHVCCIEDCISKVISESRPFCLDHNACRVQGCVKERCQFGNEFEPVCTDHFIAPCRSGNCDLKSSTSSPFCEIHACQRRNCTKDARPGRGKPFCIDHECSDADCNFLRTFKEGEGRLRRNDFCSLHECQDKDCVKHIAPEKPYCNSHCCTKANCQVARDGHPQFGSLCYHHHESRIRDAATLATERRLEEERRQQQEILAREEQLRAEEVRRRAAAAQRAREDRVREEIPIPHRQRDDRVRDEARGRGGHGMGIPEARRHEGLRPERPERHERGYEDEYEDEGYRSRPGSGNYARW